MIWWYDKGVVGSGVKSVGWGAGPGFFNKPRGKEGNVMPRGCLRYKES